ncbi:Polysaccharide pyruvyl transferase [Butyrivibrio hungatei DSM 14810]|uniref:Polysaccharide pyruvyl transferase n=1 Tax=Butyrivibrio hungatei DSM 14810 TaxID=1121132 RepID=A0A1M7T0P1_9FIRM|nr:polysaccharide pyruvyl transferase family protein [Butyrivibrio hungatei]SHN64306.1 Polysaccharide pyruvyl transferase [Butyrivibrio hungatei DSM 14810]
MGIRKCINTISNVVAYNFPVGESVETDMIRVFDTSVGSDNAGDYIIMHYCNLILDEVFGTDIKRQYVPTHVRPAVSEFIKRAPLSIFCGTNILYSNMQEHSMWKMPFGAGKTISNVVGLGLGWEYYEDRELSGYTRKIFDEIFSNDLVHSVRDKYTYEKLKAFGYNNVLFTACPTMWRLDEKHCGSIPTGKGKSVVTTITDYNKDPDSDRAMLDILKKNYEKVYVWIQGEKDRGYLESICDVSSLELIDSTYEAYTKVLESESNLDFVGTRLHAGIHALNLGHRTIIVAIDNRAKEMGKDTNLPIISREDVSDKLEGMINSEVKTEILLPTENIKRWKDQFKGDERK